MFATQFTVDECKRKAEQLLLAHGIQNPVVTARGHWPTDPYSWRGFEVALTVEGDNLTRTEANVSYALHGVRDALRFAFRGTELAGIGTDAD
jgi:hypothetical protein